MSVDYSGLKGKVIVITGASDGIGAALAKLVGSHGARVVLAARRESALQEVAAASGSETLVVAMDVTRREDHARVLASAIARFGHVDVWVNNAGRGITKPVLIKRMLTEYASDDAFISMFISETRISATLSHGNIAQFPDFGELEGVAHRSDFDLRRRFGF